MSDHYVVTLEDVILAHDEALRNGGGRPGTKDQNDILGAIGRPYQEFTGFIPYPTVSRKAGCLLHSLLNCHGFTDGNKRTAWIVCNAFLHAEDHMVMFPTEMLDLWYDQLAMMADESWDVGQVTAWLEPYITDITEQIPEISAPEEDHG